MVSLAYPAGILCVKPPKNARGCNMAFLERMLPHPGPPPKRVQFVSFRDAIACDHIRFRYVRRTISNGQERFGMQCKDCGFVDDRTWLGRKKAAEIYQCSADEWNEYHDHFTRQMRDKRLLAYLDAREEFKRSTTVEWWDWYNKYLNSAPWLKLRAAILKRDNYSCGLCGLGADQVHHLSYDRVGYEEDGDLISVCKNCHNNIHRGR